MKANQETLSQLSAEQLNEIETLYESGNPLKQRVASGLYNRSFVKTFNTLNLIVLKMAGGGIKFFDAIEKIEDPEVAGVDYRYIR